ncbi:MAG TPA: CopD family protein [Candidatus Acidoferrales bacterium]|nr:CopD family protein [Candidatus Acidoferrales bacterium]
MAERLQSIFNLLAVVLRGVTLTSEALVIGGIAFTLIALPDPARVPAAWKKTSRTILWAVFTLGLAQLAFVGLDILMLMKTADVPFLETLGADFVMSGALFLAASVAIAILLFTRGWNARWWLAPPGAALIAASVMTSHAVARLYYRAPMAMATAAHHLSMAVWIGGLPFLWIALKAASDSSDVRRTMMNFSKCAMICVAGVAGSGLALSFIYVGSWNAVYGTSYGAMVMTKSVLLLCLLAIGAINYGIVRRPGLRTITLRRLLEAELGIGITVILAAASLTSQPPAVDVVADRASASEIVSRMSPGWPRLTSPTVTALAAESHWQERIKSNATVQFVPDVPADQVQRKQRTDGVEWSEYNHHWAGLIVLTIGILAFVAKIPGGGWAKHWPLLFLALAAFLLVRSDPEVWPLGPYGFWQSFTDPEVFQHRIAVVLVIAFAIFEWRVRTGDSSSRIATLVFPIVCAGGGALLLTHTHALYNVREQLLVELTHLPLAVLACVAGWSRWLELRLPSEEKLRRTLAWMWPVCFVAIGLLLLNYREA